VIKGEIDRPKLERSLKRFAKEFGDTSAQAVVRWSIQTCRDLAIETQAWGKTGTKKKQEAAIIADAYNVVEVIDREPRGVKALKTPGEVNDWIELNRTRRRGRTAHLSWEDKKRCSRQTFNAAMKIRHARAGMAKGGWLGAGQAIASAQTGQDRINIGKNFLGYAQKHSRFGSAKKPASGWKPAASITNSASHSASSHVVRPAAIDKAINWGLKKTITWYRSAIRRQDQKQRP
jgi:hypothetical protein